MINYDRLSQQKKDFAIKLKAAFDAKDENAISQALNEFSDGVQQSLLEIASDFALTADASALAMRGIRQLTSAEQNFYDGLISAFKSSDPKQALTNANLTIPETIIDTIMDDIKHEHPLLDAIDFQNTHGSVKLLFTDGTRPLATYDKLNTAISTEISETFHEKDFSNCKLTAFIPVSKDLLALGAVYLDSYIRIILTEAIAFGKEYGIVDGTGKDQPIGMARNLDGAVVSGVYPKKEAVTLNSFEASDYCPVIANLCKRPNNTYRAVPEVLLVCNSKDYISKIIPATTVRASDGSFVNNVFPYPTKVIQSEMVEEGKIILGIAKQYIAALSSGNTQTIEYSDEYQWLEDNRVYKAKAYSYGMPKDNTSFIVCDISELKAPALLVKVVERTAETEEQTEEQTEG